MTKPILHPMSVVTRRTGLSADLIRAWERRYRAVQPSRTGGNRRLYSESEMQRLILLRDALRAGWQIGQVAALDDDTLRTLAASTGASANEREESPSTQAEELEQRERACFEAVAALDGVRLAKELDSANVSLSRVALLDRLLVPLMEHIGRACSNGTLRTANEHLASVVVRSFLDRMHGAYPVPDSAPALIVTTPMFQHHEIGALLAAATARTLGWNTVYLGPNLPSEEIAAAARQRGARAVAVSVTFPADDPRLSDELRQLARLLAPGTRLLVGGLSAPAYAATIDAIGAELLGSLDALRETLTRLRVPESRAGGERSPSNPASKRAFGRGRDEKRSPRRQTRRGN